MSRIFQTGFEWNYIHVVVNPPYADGVARLGHGATVESTVVRSGSKALKIVSGTNGTIRLYFTGALSAGRFVRVYFQKAGNPASTNTILVFGSLAVQVQTDGTLITQWSGVTQGSTSAALSNDQWYMIEVDAVTTGTFTARLDGTQFSTATGLGAGGDYTFVDLRNWSATNFYFDDFAVNNDSGASNNSWCGSGKVVLLVPISDSQVGSWLDGDGAGTTNLFQSLNNSPPTGAAADTTGTKIVTSDASGNNSTDEYRPNMTSYTTAGIGASDTINAVQGHVVTSEEITTGTKTGSFRILTNPADAGFTTIGQFGLLGGGAAGTYDTNWAWFLTTPVDAPSVTLGTSPTMALRKTDTGTRQADACAMGIYVDYTPAAVALFKQIGYQVTQAVKRASVY